MTPCAVSPQPAESMSMVMTTDGRRVLAGLAAVIVGAIQVSSLVIRIASVSDSLTIIHTLQLTGLRIPARHRHPDPGQRPPRPPLPPPGPSMITTPAATDAFPARGQPVDLPSRSAVGRGGGPAAASSNVQPFNPTGRCATATGVNS